MNKLLLILLLSGYCFAGFNIKSDVDGNLLSVVRGSPIDGAVYYSDKDQVAYSNAKTLLSSNPRNYLKMVDGKLVVKSQEEIDVIIQAVLDKAITIKTESINNLNITIKEAFIAWLELYNSKVPVQYRVTKAEMLAKVFENEGL